MSQARTRDGDSSDNIPPVGPEEDNPTARHSTPFFWKSQQVPPIPIRRSISRETAANILSIITFQWITPILVTGYRRPLELNDLWLVNPKRRAEKLAEKLASSFRKAVDDGEKQPLRRALYETLRFDFLIGGACQLIAALAQVINPFVLRYLITFSAEAYYAHKNEFSAPRVGYGIGLVFAVTLLQALQSACTDQFLYRGMITGGQARAALICIIFDKAMKISGKAKAGGQVLEQPESLLVDIKPGSNEERMWFKRCLSKRKASKPNVSGQASTNEPWDNGRITNLMSVDASRVASGFDIFHMTWSSPLAMLVTLILLLINIKASALTGFGLLLAMVPVFRIAIRSMRKRRRAINRITDQRVGLIQEILQTIRFVKCVNWEASFIERIETIRRKEIHSIQGLLMVRNGLFSVFLSIPVFASMMAFLTYGLTRNHLDPALIFSSFALFNSWRLPLSMLPRSIAAAVDGSTSVKRIEKFLLAEEAKDETRWDLTSKSAVVVQDAAFTWEQGIEQQLEKKYLPVEQRSSDDGDSLTISNHSKPFMIRTLNFTIGRGELLAVIGSVGSGKSSLLAALAGDMRKTSGLVTLGASRAFCPQTAWIRNASVRENITFGKEMQWPWYDKVVEACALRHDFDALPNGDLTEVGERGITISGGQKQRINMARAIYSRSEVVLLDDPLSAVDAHVGVHILNEAICGLLSEKCRVLATHQLWVLRRCDRIIWMEHGRINAIDTLDRLLANSAEFRNLVSTHADKDDKHLSQREPELEMPQDQPTSPQFESGEPVPSEDPELQAIQQPPALLMQEEERGIDSIPWAVYVAYARASGSLWIVPLLLSFLILSQGAQITASLWLSFWTDNKLHASRGIYLMGYTLLGVGQSVFIFAFSYTLSIGGTRASKLMHQQTLARVLRAPVSFFDTTPMGRIMNRFSRDVDIMDSTLTDAIQTFSITVAMVIAIFILIIAYYYYIACAVVPLVMVLIFAARFYRASARDFKRHESVLRSTVFARFSEAGAGIATLRAFGQQHRFSGLIRDAVDDMDSALFLSVANQRWLSCRVDFIGLVIVFILAMLVVTSRFTISPSSGGLVLSYLLFTVQLLQYTVRQLAEVEKHMNSTERIHYYNVHIEQEASYASREVSPSWPANGEIIFQDVQMRYRKGLPPVLDGVSMHIKGGERIGIVGRTGSGKSSLVNTLFRLVELSGGSVKIDGVDISTIALDDLRSRLAFIPQDPTLFRGTMRSNLDPFNKHTDLALWSALRQTGLISREKSVALVTNNGNTVNRGTEASSASLHLDSAIEDEGSNFSLGQRQLLAIARAVVRGSRIVICDEATSSVDFETDEHIQKTIFEGEAFKDKTVLCIAHRLRTIVNYDRIVVMDAGHIVEFDKPLVLFDRKDSIFHAMCVRSLIGRDAFLRDHG